METSQTISGRFVSAASGICVLAIVLAMPRLVDLIIACGHYIPQQDLASDYAKGVFWALLLGGTILFWPVSGASKKCLLLGWSAKIAVTLGAMLVYENHYGLDAYMYFAESRNGTFTLDGMRSTSGTENMINLARLHRLLFPDSYHAMKVTCALFGLLGIYLFYRAGVIFFRREDTRIFYLLAFFPGVLFWSSILGKDPLVFLGIAMYCYGVVGLMSRRQLRFVPTLLLGVALATFIRQWLGIIMMAPFGVMYFFSLKKMTSRLAFTFVILALLYVSAAPLLDRFKIEAASDLLTVADGTTKGFVNAKGGSTQQLDVDLTSPKAIALFLPQAALTALFRPLPGEVMNPFGLLAGAESSVLVVLLVLAIKRTRLRDLREPLVTWAVVFVSVWALVNGIVSCTNFGVAVRYKLQVLPLLLGLLVYLSRKRTPVAARRPPPSAAEPTAPLLEPVPAPLLLSAGIDAGKGPA